MDSSSREYMPLQFRLRPAVRLALARRNLSQNEFARACGLSSGYMSQLLTGARCAGPTVRERMCRVLGMGFDDLFEERRLG